MLFCLISIFPLQNLCQNRFWNGAYLNSSWATMGMVMTEKRVLINMISVMRVESRLYLKQRIVPYVATGMAIIRVLMLTTSVSKPSRLKRAYNSRGMMSSLNAVVIYTTREPSIECQDSRDIDEPMMSNAPGTVMLPIKVMGWLTTSGILSMLKATIIMARYAAIIGELTSTFD